MSNVATNGSTDPSPARAGRPLGATDSRKREPDDFNRARIIKTRLQQAQTRVNLRAEKLTEAREAAASVISTREAKLAQAKADLSSILSSITPEVRKLLEAAGALPAVGGESDE